MSWMYSLYETYNANTEEVGKFPQGNKQPLLPLYHSTQQAQIEAVIDMSGNWCPGQSRVLLQKEEITTIIPCTENSASRTSGSEPHPLFDKLQYVAGDYNQYISGKKCYYRAYIELLAKWCNSAAVLPQVLAVKAYLEKQRLMQDLVNDGILYCAPDGTLPEKWKGSKEDTPFIFKACTSGQSEAFVRFRVRGCPGEEALWEDPALWQSWINFQNGCQQDKDICYVLGKAMPASSFSPKKIRQPGDRAKLISSNDSTGFVFRGRFNLASEALCIGRETTEKAHSALRWLIGRQAYIYDSLAVLAWSTKVQPLQSAVCGDSLDMNCELSDWDIPHETLCTNAEVFAKHFRSALAGYKGNLDGFEDVSVIGLDSATQGRLSIFYYKEMQAEDFIQRIKDWHTSCTWLHTYRSIESESGTKGKKEKIRVPFIGAPSPKDIAEAAYGKNVDGTLKKSTIKRLLPCILDGARVPEDIMKSAAGRAANSTVLEEWEARKTLSIACALIRKFYNDRANRYSKEKNKEVWKVTVQNDCADRSYLFGRALAYARKIEEVAQWKADTDPRETNAQRLEFAFCEHPARIWRLIEKQLHPYLARLADKGGSYHEKELRKILTRIGTDGFTDEPLSPIFLLGYSAQLTEFQEEAEQRKKEKNQKSMQENEGGN